MEVIGLLEAAAVAVQSRHCLVSLVYHPSGTHPQTGALVSQEDIVFGTTDCKAITDLGVPLWY